MIYLSGSITGATTNELALFREAAAYFSMRGHVVFNPMDFAADFPDADSTHDGWTRALARDIAEICRPECRSICVLDTFERSRGSLLEIFTALTLKRSIALLPHQTDRWVTHVQSYVVRAQEALWRDVTHRNYSHHQTLFPTESPQTELSWKSIG